MRFPLFLQSFRNAQAEKEKKLFFQKVQKGLSIQFTESVLYPPTKQCNYYRLNTYMNGQNGYYRGEYDKKGNLTGCGPYSLSGSFLLGWWSFLDEKEIKDIYLYTYNRFPLDKEGKQVYKDVMTSREQNPKFISESFKQMLCWMASK